MSEKNKTTEDTMKIAVVNTKGGASKSTFAYQVLCTYFIQKGEEIKLVELDDENSDGAIFTNSQIKTSTALVGENRGDITETLRKIFNDKTNTIIDIGGNKTTTIAIDGLKTTRLYNLIDLFVIPMSGGSQDFLNAIKTYDLIKEYGKPIIFGLSRVRRADRIKRQYEDFFREFPKEQYMILTDSDTIDLSRKLKKSVYELAIDTAENNLIANYDTKITEFMNDGNMEEAYQLVDIVDILQTSVEYKDKILEPCYMALDEILGK